MSRSERYDVVVLGSGAAGKILAWTLASQGRRTVVIERKYLGGSCPNIACLPSKNVIHSARVASLVKRGEEFGAPAARGPVDMAVVRDRKRRMVEELIEIHRDKFQASGAEVVMGEGRFVASKTLEVAIRGGGTRNFEGEVVIVNTGSRARIDDISGLVESRPLTHVEALELDRVPEHLIVLGGGYVGLELAQAFRRFGSRVTILERNPALIHREDPDVSEAVESFLRDEEIAVQTGSDVLGVEGRSGETIRLRTGRGVIEGSHLLVAGGRTPNTDRIGLEATGIELDARGHIKVDERRRTTAQGVWAVGDCAGGPYFTHIAVDDARVVLSDLAGGGRTTEGRLAPYCLFIDPELARIGLNEREARERGVAYRLAKIPVAEVLRARTISEDRGFLKALVDANGDRILGFTALAPEAGEIMAAVQVAMIAGLPYTTLRDAILTHPTMAEGLGDLFGQVPARA